VGAPSNVKLVDLALPFAEIALKIFLEVTNVKKRQRP
jgi:hypothetical protein